jgi:hypothetical protein
MTLGKKLGPVDDLRRNLCIPRSISSVIWFVVAVPLLAIEIWIAYAALLTNQIWAVFKCTSSIIGLQLFENFGQSPTPCGIQGCRILGTWVWFISITIAGIECKHGLWYSIFSSLSENKHFCPRFDEIGHRLRAALVAKVHIQFWCTLMLGLDPTWRLSSDHTPFVTSTRASEHCCRSRIDRLLYKKQLNKIEGCNRDGRAKKYMNKICGDNHIHYACFLSSRHMGSRNKPTSNVTINRLFPLTSHNNFSHMQCIVKKTKE